MAVSCDQGGGEVSGSIARTGGLPELGRISYCAYIIHVAVNLFCHRLLLHANPSIADWRGVGVSVLALVLTFAIAQASWTFFEGPLLRLGHSFKY